MAEIRLKFSSDTRAARADLQRFRQLLTETLKEIGAKTGASDRERIRSSALASRETIRTERERVTAVTRLEGDAQRERERLRTQEAAAVERIAREQIRTAAAAARERERSESAGVRAAATAERERIRTASLAAREFQKLEREKLRTVQTTARSASRSYEDNLGRGFFAKLGRAATSGFREGFQVGGETFGGGGLVGGALSVLGGNVLASAVSKLGSELKAQITDAFNFIDVQEKAQLAFEVIFRNAGLSAEEAAGKARAHLAELLEARDLRRAFGTEALIELSQQLQAVGFRAEEIIPSLRAVGNAVSVYADAPQRLQRIFLQLSQLTTTQQVSGEELRVLAENGVPAWRYLSEYAGKSVAQVRKLARDGMLDAQVAVRVILKGMERDFGGLLDATAGTYSQQWRTITELNRQRAAEAFEPAFQEVKKGQAAAIAGLESAAAEGFTKGAGEVQRAVLGGFDNVLSAVASGDFKALGLSVIDSAAEGVKAGAQGLYDATREAAGEVEKGWRERLDQHSPSHLLFGLGFEAGASLAEGFHAGFMQRGAGFREYLKQLVADPRIKAWFEVIRQVEGGGPDVMVGRGRVASGRRHPGEVVPRSQWYVGQKGPSSAAGNWQVTLSNWRKLRGPLGLDDFSDVDQQMLAALALFAEGGGPQALLSGDLAGALRASAPWAATPRSHLPGRKPLSSAQFIDRYQQLLSGQRPAGAPVPPAELPPEAARQLADLRREVAALRDFSGFPGSPLAAAEEVLKASTSQLAAERKAEAERLRAEAERLRGLAADRGPFARPEMRDAYLSQAGALERRAAGLESAPVTLENNQRAFIEWLAAAQRGGSLNPGELFGAAGRFGVSAEFTRQAEAEVSRRVERERALLAEIESLVVAARGMRAGLGAGGQLPAGTLRPGDLAGLALANLKPGDVAAGVDASAAERARLAHFELLKAITDTGPASERSFGQAGEAVDKLTQKTAGLGNLVKGEGEGILGPLNTELEKLTEETDFTALELAGQTLGQTFISLKENLLSSVDAIILGGESLKDALAQSLRDTLAQTAGFLAKKALLKGLEETAEALSSLAVGDFRGFAQHTAAAAGWFALAGAAAIGGRVLAGSRKGAAGGAGALGGGSAYEDRQPNNREFSYHTTPESASEALHGGSRGGGIGPMLERLVARVEQAQQMNAVTNHKLDQTLSRIQSLPAGEVVTMGASDARRAIGAAVLEHSGEDYGFTRTMLEREGWAS